MQLRPDRLVIKFSSGEDARKRESRDRKTAHAPPPPNFGRVFLGGGRGGTQGGAFCTSQYCADSYKAASVVFWPTQSSIPRGTHFLPTPARPCALITLDSVLERSNNVCPFLPHSPFLALVVVVSLSLSLFLRCAVDRAAFGRADRGCLKRGGDNTRE